MSRPMSTLVFVLTLVAYPVLAQAPPRSPAPPAVALKRTVYEVRCGSAGELANALSRHYASETSFHVVAAGSSNSLLLSAPPNVLEEVLRSLELLDRRPRTFAVEVLFADAAGQPADAAALDSKTLSGTADDVAARLDALKQQGRLTGLRCIRLAATEGQRASVNSAAEVSIVTAVQRFGGGRGGAVAGDQGFAGGRGGPVPLNVERRNVGTLIEVLPRVAPDGIVQLDLKVEDSRVVTEVGAGDAAQAMPVLTVTTVTGAVSVRVGQAAVATGLTESGTTRRQTAVIVTVRPSEPGAVPSK